MEVQKLRAFTRAKAGKGASRELRRNGRIPAVLYGPGSEPTLLSVDGHELEMMLKKISIGKQLIQLSLGEGQSERTTMIKELQQEPLSRRMLHADFYEVSMDRKIRVKVPVRTIGKAKGIEFGGMLQIIRRELEILCLPLEIPEMIEIDISELNIGDSVHVEDIPTKGGIEIPHEVNFTILTVLSQAKKEKEGGEESEGAEDSEQAAAGNAGA
ncbi:MAG: 50S ribosomal protein L25 [Thermodesulfobacteriota bacterium]